MTVAAAGRVRVMREPLPPITCYACAHPACVIARADWRDRTCVFCHKQIETGERFTDADAGGLKHLTCPGE